MMARDRIEALEMLELHHENLQACTTFDDYKRVHVAYVELLIAEVRADIAKQETRQKFMKETEFVTKAEWRQADGFDAAGKCTYLLPERGHCAVCDEAFATP